jgi:hypothetical protein
METVVDEQIKKEDIETVLNGILTNAKNELLSKTQSDLEDYWYFRYDADRSKEWNLYQFTKALDLYKSNCRRWEEHHNGNSCVVERVRDQYLMPKITQFIKDMV